MKFKHLLVSLLAVAAFSATSCQDKEKDLGLPEIKISQNELTLDQGVASTSLDVYATRNWTVSTAADWISVNPSKGNAYTETKVTVTILENESYDRTGTVKFDIGYDSKTLTINQAGALGAKSEGSGTLDDPYTVAGVIEFIETLGTETSEQAVYIKGKVQAITLKYADSGTYGNARFTMIDEGVSDKVFTAYNVLYLGNKKWASGQTDIVEGDEVIVCGKVYNYGGKTPENASGAYLYSLNGETAGGGGSSDEAKGTGTLEDPYNPAGIAAAVANLTWTSTTEYQTTDPVYVKGIISKIADNGTFTDGGTYGNATFYISETGETTGTEFYAYRVLYLGNKKFASGQTDIKVGDEVILYGKMMNYRGNTPETASGCYVYSLNGDTGSGTSGGGGDTGDVKSVTVAEFNAAAESSTQVYELVGTIGGNINTTYGNFDLTDDSGTVYVYGLTATNLGYGATNDKSYASLNLAAGDKIKIRGFRGSYGDKIEVVYAYFVEKVSGGTSGGSGDTGGGGDTSGNELVFSTNADATVAGVTFSFAKGSGSTAPAWNTNYNELRLYLKNTISVKSDKNIKKIDFYFHKQGDKAWQSIALTSGGGTYTDCEASSSSQDSKKASWEGTSKELLFTMGDVSGGQRVLEKVVVTVE